MANIEINDINEDMQISEEELKHVKGGGLLLPAVQKVNAVTQKVNITSGIKATLGDGSV